MVIQKYFSCEGIFDMVYQYHFRLLLHLIGKKPLDIPFYLFKSLGKMENNVQAKLDTRNRYIFHHGVIKLLVVEELKRLNRYWLTLLFLSGYELDVATPSRRTPRSKSTTPRKEKQLVA